MGTTLHMLPSCVLQLSPEADSTQLICPCVKTSRQKRRSAGGHQDDTSISYNTTNNVVLSVLKWGTHITTSRYIRHFKDWCELFSPLNIKCANFLFFAKLQQFRDLWLSWTSRHFSGNESDSTFTIHFCLARHNQLLLLFHHGCSKQSSNTKILLILLLLLPGRHWI